jgi:hypothetical protein
MTEPFSAQNRAPAVCSMSLRMEGFGRRAAAPASTAAAAVPGVVLCVAYGIVRIVAGAGDPSGGRPRREINVVIGVAAGEDERCDQDCDAERGRFSPHLSRPVGGSFGTWAGQVVHHALLHPGGDPNDQRTLNFNSMRRQRRSRLTA